MLKCNIVLFNSRKNLHALLKYQRKSQGLLFMFIRFMYFYVFFVPFYAQIKFSGVISVA